MRQRGMSTTTFPPARRTAGAVFSMALAALLATACGSSLQSGSAGTADESAARAPQTEYHALPEGGAAGEQAAEAEPGDDLSVDSEVEVGDRRLVHTADMTVRVEDVSEAVDQAKRLTIDAGGYIAHETLSTPRGGTPAGSLTLRVPSEGYEEALEDLAELGDRSNLERSVEDVTEEIADVESRVESAETALETLRGYLEEAENVDDLLRVEREIQTRQSELEAFQARLETLNDQTSYSTVHLTLSPPETYVEAPANDSIGFLGGLERGLLALGALGEGVAVVAGWLLPFVVTVAVLGAGPLWWYRARRSGRPTRGGSRSGRVRLPWSGRGGPDTEEETGGGETAPSDDPGKESPEDRG